MFAHIVCCAFDAMGSVGSKHKKKYESNHTIYMSWRDRARERISMRIKYMTDICWNFKKPHILRSKQNTSTTRTKRYKKCLFLKWIGYVYTCASVEIIIKLFVTFVSFIQQQIGTFVWCHYDCSGWDYCSGFFPLAFWLFAQPYIANIFYYSFAHFGNCNQTSHVCDYKSCWRIYIVCYAIQCIEC